MSLLKEKPKVGKRKRENGNRKTTMCTEASLTVFWWAVFSFVHLHFLSSSENFPKGFRTVELQRRLALRNAVCFRSALGRIFRQDKFLLCFGLLLAEKRHERLGQFLRYFWKPFLLCSPPGFSRRKIFLVNCDHKLLTCLYQESYELMKQSQFLKKNIRARKWPAEMNFDGIRRCWVVIARDVICALHLQLKKKEIIF